MGFIVATVIILLIIGAVALLMRGTKAAKSPAPAPPPAIAPSTAQPSSFAQQSSSTQVESAPSAAPLPAPPAGMIYVSAPGGGPVTLQPAPTIPKAKDLANGIAAQDQQFISQAQGYLQALQSGTASTSYVTNFLGIDDYSRSSYPGMSYTNFVNTYLPAQLRNFIATYQQDLTYWQNALAQPSMPADALKRLGVSE